MQTWRQTIVFLIAGFPACFGIAVNAYADVFQSVDAQGVVHLSNIPGGAACHVLVHATSSSKPVRVSQQTKTARIHKVEAKHYEKALKKAAHDQHIDLALLQAIVSVESNYNPAAVSSAGAVGLMQLMPATAKRYGISDRFDPEKNIQAGARYLHDLVERYHDNLPLALAAYNAGENAVDRYGKRIPPFPETRNYVPRVLSLYRQYSLSLP